MKIKTTVDLIDAVSDGCSACLPINNSLIPLLILNQTMTHFISEKDLSLKNLYTSINSSELGARNHVTRLEKNSWVAIEKSSADTRVKLIKPTKKLLDTYEQLSLNLTSGTQKFCIDCPNSKTKF